MRRSDFCIVDGRVFQMNNDDLKFLKVIGIVRPRSVSYSGVNLDDNYLAMLRTVDPRSQLLMVNALTKRLFEEDRLLTPTAYRMVLDVFRYSLDSREQLAHHLLFEEYAWVEHNKDTLVPPSRAENLYRSFHSRPLRSNLWAYPVVDSQTR